LLRGCRMDKNLVSEAKKVILSEVHFRTSPHRATSEYRRYICGVLLEETLATAWQRALQQW
jgi:CO/xanthine dehydrogenase FAD-binding subunit